MFELDPVDDESHNRMDEVGGDEVCYVANPLGNHLIY